MRDLLDHGADINAQDKHGAALVWATYLSHTETVNLLLDRGADVNARNKHGDTALLWAERLNRNQTVKELRKRYAPEEKTDNTSDMNKTFEGNAKGENGIPKDASNESEDNTPEPGTGPARKNDGHNNGP